METVTDSGKITHTRKLRGDINKLAAFVESGEEQSRYFDALLEIIAVFMTRIDTIPHIQKVVTDRLKDINLKWEIVAENGIVEACFANPEHSHIGFINISTPDETTVDFWMREAMGSQDLEDEILNIEDPIGFTGYYRQITIHVDNDAAEIEHQTKEYGHGRLK